MSSLIKHFQDYISCYKSEKLVYLWHQSKVFGTNLSCPSQTNKKLLYKITEVEMYKNDLTWYWMSKSVNLESTASSNQEWTHLIGFQVTISISEVQINSNMPPS